MREIKVPQINANDTTYLINEIYFQNGDEVKQQDIIASIGSSKAVNDIESEFDGFIYYLKNSSDEIDALEVFAYIFETKEAYDNFISNTPKTAEDKKNESYILTKPAQKFAKENNITHEQILSLNKKIIKTQDLENLLKTEEAEEVHSEDDLIQKLPLNQIQTARIVIESHKTIPQAFHLIKTDCTKCGEFLKEFSDKTGIITGFSEVITVILSELFKEFPVFFSRYIKENKVALAKFPVIGTTIDTGSGLFMPSIKCHKSITLEEVSEIMFDFKMKSLDNSFLEQDLETGNISISYNPYKNIVTVVPVIFTNQSAMVSICSPVKELCFDENKNVVEKSFLYIGLAFDHRVINGSNAMLFLNRISEKIEKSDFAIFKEDK